MALYNTDGNCVNITSSLCLLIQEDFSRDIGSLWVIYGGSLICKSWIEASETTALTT